MVQIILGKSEEIDTVFLAAIKQRFTDVPTDFYGYRIVLRALNVFKKRGNLKAYDQILRQIGYHALYLSKDPHMGQSLVVHAINLNNFNCSAFIACGLQGRYIELSVLKHGSNIVEMLLDDCTSAMPLILMVMEIVRCDEDTLMRLAKDKYGNKVLKMTLEIAKEYKDEYFGDLVDKFKPFLDSLRGSLGENLVAIIDSEPEEIVKDQIVSEGN